MSSLAEIQEAIKKLASEDRARLREWFDAQDAEETDELLAVIDEGIRSAETERTFSLEEVRAEIKKWATKSAWRLGTRRPQRNRCAYRSSAQDNPLAAEKLGNELAAEADNLSSYPYRVVWCKAVETLDGWFLAPT
jgi:sugar-specific transcriptional regulator TrmB